VLQQSVMQAPEPASVQPKVYSYSRWSTPEQAKGDSFRRQAEAAQRWAERHGYILDDTLRITDEGISAFRGSNALDGGLSRFLEACRKNLIEPGSFLLVESLDRISRMPPRKAQRLIDDIVDNEVTIVTLNDDQHYTSTRLDNDPTALLIAMMVSWRAHEESKTKGRRVAAAWDEKRRRVRANPSERLTRRGPSWLIPTVEGGWSAHPAKSATVQRIFAMTLAGAGENLIAARLNMEKVPVLGRGRHWHRSTVSKVLRNPAVVGTLIPGQIRYVDGQRVRVTETPIENAFPAVVAEADWLAVRAIKDGRTSAARGRHAGRSIAHLFAGLTRCPTCGAAMTRVMKGNAAKAGHPKLVCTAAKTKAGCRYVSVPLGQLEEAFLCHWGALFENAPAPDGSTLNAEYDALSAAIWGTEDHLENLADTLKRAPLQSTMREMARLQAQLGTMRGQLEELDERRRMADGGLIRSRLGHLQELLEVDTGDLDRAAINVALKILFAAIIVDYQAGRLRFRWRQGGEASVRYAWAD
jgi:DNA invertase Pin-like site-specific DNA recombinase